MLIIVFIFLLILCLLLLVIGLFLEEKDEFKREKNTPFECGFDPKGSARSSFSLQFFLVGVIFLIFDVEITILLPFSLLRRVGQPLYWLGNLIIFIFILLLGLYFEWGNGALEWII